MSMLNAFVTSASCEALCEVADDPSQHLFTNSTQRDNELKTMITVLRRHLGA
jgi:hypothetical protein